MREKGRRIVDAVIAGTLIVIEVIAEQGIRKAIEWVSRRKRRRKQEKEKEKQE